jgi:hypothetical protein
MFWLLTTGPDAMNATQKNLSPLQTTDSEKTLKLPLLAILAKNGIFFYFFLDFFRNYTLQSVEFSA